jgi:PhnB protein
MEMNTYLTFNGQCEAAFKFYEQSLGGKIVMMLNHENSPMAEHTPAGWQDKIMHARLILGDQILMGSDAPPNSYEQPKGFSVSILAADTAEAERVFQALADNGTVQMPIQETFWAHRFGMLVDQFGIPWMVNHEKPANP